VKKVEEDVVVAEAVGDAAAAFHKPNSFQGNDTVEVHCGTAIALPDWGQIVAFHTMAQDMTSVKKVASALKLLLLNSPNAKYLILPLQTVDKILAVFSDIGSLVVDHAARDDWICSLLMADEYVL
jgi:hypothetical protein